MLRLEPVTADTPLETLKREKHRLNAMVERREKTRNRLAREIRSCNDHHFLVVAELRRRKAAAARPF